MTRPLAAALVLCLCAGTSCRAHRTAAPNAEPSNAAAPGASAAAIARALERRGDHLGASIYWEAALAAEAAERDLLPALIAAEVRAGRLRAARTNVARLEALDPNRPGVARLRRLLDDLLAAGAPPPPSGGSR